MLLCYFINLENDSTSRVYKKKSVKSTYVTIWFSSSRMDSSTTESRKRKRKWDRTFSNRRNPNNERPAGRDESLAPRQEAARQRETAKGAAPGRDPCPEGPGLVGVDGKTPDTQHELERNDDIVDGRDALHVSAGWNDADKRHLDRNTKAKRQNDKKQKTRR